MLRQGRDSQAVTSGGPALGLSIEGVIAYMQRNLLRLHAFDFKLGSARQMGDGYELSRAGVTVRRRSPPAKRSHATAPWRARLASGMLPAELHYNMGPHPPCGSCHEDWDDAERGGCVITALRLSLICLHPRQGWRLRRERWFAWDDIQHIRENRSRPGWNPAPVSRSSR